MDDDETKQQKDAEPTPGTTESPEKPVDQQGQAGPVGGASETEVMPSGANGTDEPTPGISEPAGDHAEPAAETSVGPDASPQENVAGLIRCTSCGTWVNHMNVCLGCGAQLSLQER